MIKPYNDLEYNKYNNDYIKVSKYEKKEKKCTETYIGKICVDKFNEKRYIPDKNINYEFVKPYSDTIIKIPLDEYDHKLESDKLSCKNVDYLNAKYFDQNTIILTETDPIKPTNYDYEKDLYILRGIPITPYSCNKKHEKYKEGLWINQFQENDFKSNNMFNINTKKKSA